ncbi:MAG: aminoacyl-histidine dipeptidase [Tannerella sp.]|jgi:dipeptidase D|nr:aminoacyl-histidine dipeptidase [Tannerella sp.]
MTIKDLSPKEVWNYFYEITQVPRPSKKEGKIIEYIEGVSQKHKISIKKDKVGNLLLFKEATKGYEDFPTVILQAHIDMVCEKNSNIKHDFEKDPIKTVINGEWLCAEGTTLGADNGIGVAAALAVITSKDVEHGPVECLFTVDEETGLTGANALQKDFMTGKILLNLDSEDEGEIFIGCAGGKNTTVTFNYSAENASKTDNYFKIAVSGLNGGHSGGDIHKGLGNANKILARFLYQLLNKYEFTLAEIEGGNLHNAIAREAFALIGTDAKNKEKIRALLNVFAADIEKELKSVDSNVKLTMETAAPPEKNIPNALKTNLIHALLACPHGVIGMSHDIEGLVETSTNLASVKMTGNNKIVIITSQRSSIESAKNAVADQVAAVFKLAGAKVMHGDGYPGWMPNADSRILEVAKNSYRKLFGKDAKIMAIHAGLECGLFLEKYPYLDMISFGPTLRSVHSPDERIEIKTVDMWWKHLLDILKNVQ